MKLKSVRTIDWCLKCIFEDNMVIFVPRGYTTTQIYEVRKNELERRAIRGSSGNDKRFSDRW